MARAARVVVLTAGVLCLLTACQDEPDFDERYQAAEEKIRTKAAELDSAIAEADRGRAAKGVDATGAPAEQ